MQFKVGDRVEAIKPPINLEKSDPDEVGIGVIKEVNPRPFDGAYLVKLDSGPEWAYWESYLRPAPIATPTPSITVGTQVRLTGVVEPDPAEGGGGIYLRTAGGHSVYLNSSAKEDLEVIRQPFKRGEVVYNRDESEPEPFVVLNDESLGMVDVACCRTGFHIANDNPEAYERRP